MSTSYAKHYSGHHAMTDIAPILARLNGECAIVNRHLITLITTSELELVLSHIRDLERERDDARTKALEYCEAIVRKEIERIENGLRGTVSIGLYNVCQDINKLQSPSPDAAAEVGK